MILYIAEKPSLGRAIAAAISGRHKNNDGFIELANGDRVSWCIGHLLELAAPEVYDAALKTWKPETLPIVPFTWKLVPKTNTRKQLTQLKALIKQADQIVHAGDPDREGQLLVDEVIRWAGASTAKISAVQRCLINDLNPPAVRQALAQLRPNREFIPLSTSALARSHADWLYGINLTRAYTLQGRAAGYQGLLSVGRVQTPVLGLVVRRDLDIEQFCPHPFYEVWARLHTPAGDTFAARWVPGEACQPYLDSEGRNLSKPLADNVAARITDQPARVETFSNREKRQPPPLPHCLSSLQIDANKKLGLTAKQVLDICQALYETHKVITYPRSDCRYLPAAHHAQAAAVCSAIRHHYAGDTLLLGALETADLQRRSGAWNDTKVDAHHAIIPTATCSQRLSDSERRVYELIARQYLAQFLPDARTDERKAGVRIGTGLFTASSHRLLVPGWKTLFPPARTGTAKGGPDAGEPAEGRGDFSEAGGDLPMLRVGQSLHSGTPEVREKVTTPPRAFTEATLLAAMTGIGQYVTDPELRKILKETDGLGTEATRAGIIELLCQRQFIVRNGKTVTATPSGRALIAVLPAAATTPDMTARWESTLNAISQASAGYDDLMTPLQQQVGELVSGSLLPSAVFKGHFQGVTAAPPVKRRRASAAGAAPGSQPRRPRTATSAKSPRPARRRKDT